MLNEGELRIDGWQIAEARQVVIYLTRHSSIRQPLGGSTVIAAIDFVLSYLGIAISLWSMIVPYKFSLWEAASSPATQAFLAVGTLFLLPVILGYTAWSYWVFRGKVRADIAYH
jgi:cytochrome bd-type quinol oxidase subunit 2